MNGRRKVKRWLGSVAAALLVALATAPLSLAEVGDSASGVATQEGADYTHTYEFDAQGGPGVTATGTMAYSDTGGVPVVATVDCLWVDRDRAVLSGTIIAGHIMWLGGRMTFSVEDRGTPGAGVDRIYAAYGTPGGFVTGENCEQHVPLTHPITTGDIVVVDGSDPDRDGRTGADDNCPGVANPDQRDIDRDGRGDACDPTDDRTADEQVADLITQLQTSPAGPGGSYVAKLQSIAASMGDGNANAACNKLTAFANEVRAQTGKKLTQSEADALLRETGAIKSKAGCA